MKNQNKRETKKKIEIIFDSVINKSINDIKRILDQKIKKGENIFDAIDTLLQSYNLEDEIIIKYEIESLKSGLNKNELGLTPKELEIIKQKIVDQIYKEYL